MRKHWIDNLRWVTVLLVLAYHVVYFFNNKGVPGGIGGFGEGPQYQDTLMYVLYPWFMPLLFILAGISARYALERKPACEWFKARTRKLLVPSTIGLFFFGALLGWINSQIATTIPAEAMAQLPPEAQAQISAGAPAMAELPGFVQYIIWAISGTGPLWFIQDLWLLSIVLILVNWLDSRGRLYKLCGKINVVTVILLGVFFFLGHQTLIQNPNPLSADGLINLYKPQFYVIPLLLGFFVFAHDKVQEMLGRFWISLMTFAIAAFTVLITLGYGQDISSPEFLSSPVNNIYGWLMCLAMMGWFKARFDKTGPFASYMTRSSYGIYILHYLVVASLGTLLKQHTDLSPALIYVLMFLGVFGITPIFYELVRRIPFLRWCALGEGNVTH